MAQLVVRNLDGDVKERLRERAAKHGHSMEEEVREILRAAVLSFRPGEFEELRGEFFRPAEFDE
jgi:plasmid stability protein